MRSVVAWRFCVWISQVVALPYFPANAADSKYWVVDRRAAECLLDNIQGYSRIDGDPIVIFMRSCPENRIPQNNSILPDVPFSNLDSVIFYSKKELACLSKINLYLERDPEKAFLPRKPEC